MTFKESIQTCFSKYADFNGRASRPEYWWFYLFVLLVYMVAYVVIGRIAGLLCILIVLPSLAAGARRMHDIDKSGWWLLIGIIPILGALVLIYFLVQPGKEPNRFGPAAST
jgi:uncharacterized membrane protein YhaH (DUF805 family)